NATHERIQEAFAAIFDRDVTDEEVADFARTSPAFFHLVSEQARGRLKDARTATDRFLRRLSENLFDYLLVGALAFFRRGQSTDVETLLSTEMCALAAHLAIVEQGGRDINRTDDEYLALLERFSHLILIEERRRSGDFTWIGTYRLLARVSDTWP